MANVSGWYDPVCYQFFFFAVDNMETSESLLKAYRQFVDELTPCYMQWLEKGGRLMGNLGSKWQRRITMINNEGDFAGHRCALSEHSGGNCSILMVPGKTLSRFAAPARSIPKEWRDQASLYTDAKLWGTVDKAKQKEWLYQLINCPSDDLRGIYFPKRSFVPHEIPLTLSLSCDSTQSRMAYMDEVVKDFIPSISHSGIGQQQYLHCIHVSIPRYILDSMEQSFPLQGAWKDRLTALCEEFEHSVGYMKMDACELRSFSTVRTMNDNFLLGFSKCIPDIAWAMCLTPYQVEALGGLDYLQKIELFHCIEALGNGHIYLQLTPDISCMTKDETNKLWSIVAPHLKMSPCCLNSISDVPISFRLGLKYCQLQIDDHGQYRILSQE